MPKICKVAIVGAGYMAAQHIQAFAGIAGVEVTGVFSRSRARAEQLASSHSNLVVYDSVADLHDRTQADIVVVAVNELSANLVACECFAFPWLVLLEKPAGLDLADGVSIAEAARARSRRVFVGLNRRHYSSTRTALERLGRLDGPRFIKVQDQEDIVEALQHGKPERVIANWMYANAIHVIDYFRIFGRGDIVKVTPVVPWTPASPGVVVSYLEFSSGDIGLYEAVWNQPGPWAVTVSTAQERYELRPLEQVAVQLNGQRQLTVLPSDPIDRDFKPGLRRQAELAVRAARGEPTELPTVEDALQSMHLVARIYGLDAKSSIAA